MIIPFPKKGIIRASVETTLIQPYSTTLPKAKAKYLHNKARVGEFTRLGAHGLQRFFDGNKFWDVPVISGTSRKAVIFRQACANKILETIVASGKKVDLADILSLMTGVEKTAKSNEKIKAEGGDTTASLTGENVWRKAHPLQGMFGIFTKSSTFDCSAAYPKTRDEKFISYILGTRMDPVNKWYEELSDADKAKYLKIKALCTDKSLLEAEIMRKGMALDEMEEGSGDAKDLEKEIAKMEKDVEIMESKMEGFNIALLMPIPPRHIVPPGLIFESSWIIRDVSSITPLSMALYGLNEFSRFPKLGAYQTSGGQVEEKHIVSLHDFSGEKSVVTPLFSLHVGNFEDFKASTFNELGDQYLKAAQADTSWHDKV